MRYTFDIGEPVPIVVEVKDLNTGLRLEDLSDGNPGVTVKVLSPARAVIVSAAKMVEIENMKGHYEYVVPGTSITEAGLWVYDVTGNNVNVENKSGSFLVAPIWITTLKKIFGLAHGNIHEDSLTYDPLVPNRKTGSRIRIYSQAASVGTDNDVLATYTFIATYSEDGLVKTFSCKET